LKKGFSIAYWAINYSQFLRHRRPCQVTGRPEETRERESHDKELLRSLHIDAQTMNRLVLTLHMGDEIEEERWTDFFNSVDRLSELGGPTSGTR